MAQVASILNIPQTVRPFSIAYLGYPAQHLPGRSRYNPKAIHWQTYSPRKLRKKAKPKVGHY